MRCIQSVEYTLATCPFSRLHLMVPAMGYISACQYVALCIPVIESFRDMDTRAIAERHRWMGLQSRYELELEQDRLAEKLAGAAAYPRTHDAHTQAG